MSECAVSDGLGPCELLAQQDQLSDLEQWRHGAEELLREFLGTLLRDHSINLFFRRIPKESKLIILRPKVLAENPDEQSDFDALAGLRKACRERTNDLTKEPTVGDVKAGIPQRIANLFEEARAKIMAGSPDAVKSCVGGIACEFAELQTAVAN